MNILQYIALVPSWLFILGVVTAIVVFDVAKIIYDREDTISVQVYRWYLVCSIIKDLFVFAAGFLTCHLFGV